MCNLIVHENCDRIGSSQLSLKLQLYCMSEVTQHGNYRLSQIYVLQLCPHRHPRDYPEKNRKDSTTVYRSEAFEEEKAPLATRSFPSGCLKRERTFFANLQFRTISQAAKNQVEVFCEEIDQGLK